MILFGQANKRAAKAGVLLALASLLGACESSSRIGSLLPGDPIRSAPRQISQAPAPLTPAPSSEVESSALPPPPGASTTSTLPPPQSAPGTAPGGVATAPGVPVAPPVAPPAPRIATAPVPAAPAAAPSRTALIGNWSVSEAAGARCKITLSSAPKLDLYGAGTSGCQNKELQRVNAWELAGSEVILYEPGGGVVARLRQAGGQGYAGATAKSGAPVSLSK